MKILITGGYGFIGSHVGDRFIKEGHDVCIIDNLATGKTENVKFKHKSYIIDIYDRKCEEVFRINKFDMVIHLAAQIDVETSIEEPYTDAKSNVLGLINILELSSKYGVKKFIFPSSAAVYGNNTELPLMEKSHTKPLSPYGINKLNGEGYCNIWSDLYNLETISFRFSNVYGPRQGLKGEGGVVSIFLERLFEDKGLVIYGDGEQTRDFIYVEDVADAIYRSTETKICGVFNLSTKKNVSINSLIEILQKHHSVKSLEYKEDKNGDIRNSLLDNDKIKLKLDWVPIYDIEMGIKKTFEWYEGYQDNHNISESNKIKKKNKIKDTYMPYIENIAMFCIIMFIATFISRGFEVSLENYLVCYIVFSGIMYGAKQSFIASVLACGAYIFNEIRLGHDLISFIYYIGSFIQLSFFVLVGIVVGYYVDKKNSEIFDLNSNLENLKERFFFLNSIHNETRIVKEELEYQIINSEDSFGKMYKIVNKLESLESEEIFYSSIDVIKETMEAKKIAVYLISKDSKYLRLIAKSNEEDFLCSQSMKIEENKIFHDVIKDKYIFTNKELKENVPHTLAPIFSGEKVVALVAIFEQRFENVTLHYKNLFKIITNLISSTITKANMFKALQINKDQITNTVILNKDYFEKLIEIKKNAKSKLNIEYTKFEIEWDLSDKDKVSRILDSSLRDYDYASLEENKIQILLSNTVDINQEIITKRLKDSGI